MECYVKIISSTHSVAESFEIRLTKHDVPKISQSQKLPSGPLTRVYMPVYLTKLSMGLRETYW